MNLIEKLKFQTQILKAQFIEKSIEWAEAEYTKAQEMSLWKEIDWVRYLGVDFEERVTEYGKTYVTFKRGFYNTRESAIYRREQIKAQRISKTPQAEYIAKAVEKAEQHYENSIQKLASRIVKKGIDTEKAEVQDASIGIHIGCIITDGIKTVRAWTIVAGGVVQKPHYRYLVN